MYKEILIGYTLATRIYILVDLATPVVTGGNSGCGLTQQVIQFCEQQYNTIVVLIKQLGSNWPFSIVLRATVILFYAAHGLSL